MTQTFTVVEETPTQEAKASTGRSKFWVGRVVTDGEQYYLQSEAWQLTSDGSESKHILSEPALVTPKGKKTAAEQATGELASTLKKKQDKGYDNVGSTAVRTFTLPMLAHSLKDKAHTIKYPVYVQPKYNGCRCLFDRNLGAWSRQGNLFITEVTAHITTALKNVKHVLDGELLLPAPYTFQQGISATKKFDPETSPLLQYIVYDTVDTSLPFKERWNQVLDLGFRESGTVQRALSWTARNAEEMEVIYQQLVKAGFEGAIIRSPSGKYTPGHRSKDLLKYKPFFDAEFEIIGHKTGKGKFAQVPTFRCKTPEGRTFDVTPEGTAEHRAKLLQDADSLVGKKLTVRYQVLTDDLVPLFPVGVSIRDYE